MLQVKCSIQRLEHNYCSTDSICRGYSHQIRPLAFWFFILEPLCDHIGFFVSLFCTRALLRNGGWINVYTRTIWLSIENQMWTLHLKSTLQRWSVKFRQGSFSWEKQPWPLSSCTFHHEVRRLWEILPQGAADWLLLFFHHNMYQLLLFWHISLKRVEVLFPTKIIHQV